jgi:hypothetical protein
MRPIAPLLAATLVLAAALGCGSSSPPPPTGTPDAGTPVVIPTCDASLKPVGASAAPAAQVQRLTAAGSPAQVGTVLPFVVPANTVSITIVEQAVSAPDAVTFSGSPLENTAVPLRVTAPSGEVWYDDTQQPAPDPVNTIAFFASSSPATGTLTIPNTTAGLDRGTLPAGTWTVTVSDYAYECTVLSPNPCGQTGQTTSTYDVTVITKSAAAGGGVPPAGTLDVTFHVVGTQTAAANPARPLPTSAAAVEADPDLARMVSTLRSIYADSGVTIRNVTYVVAPDDVRATYFGLINVDSSGACTPLAQLLKTGADGGSIHIFLVNGFTGTGLPANAVVAGVDGTIPGPATVGGTVASGAAVSTDNLRGGRCGATDPVSYTRCGDDLTAMIVAHEMGHFLGLYHVTELHGLLFDPLAETPTCACSACKATAATDACSSSASGHTMASAECAGAGARAGCGGGDNLMFWFTPTSLVPLTSEQQRVVRANPQVQ